MQPYWLRTVKFILKKRRFPARALISKWRAAHKADKLFQSVIRQLGPGDLVIDCGANVGSVTKRLFATGATVHAFEPDPYCFEILSREFGKCNNVILHNKAVGVSNKTIKFYRAPNFTSRPRALSVASSVFGSKTDVDSSAPLEVEQIDFVEFIENLPDRVHLMKLDIEGAEVPVLEGLLERNLFQKIDHTFAETHEAIIPELKARTFDLKQRFSERGYQNINLDWE